jgi:hypothetical protein
MIDRYTKTVLTLIAGALIYLCIVMTPLPSVSAQSSARPGESTGPAEVVVVGWKQTTPLSIVSPEPLRVVTERAGAGADRVVVVGYEENAQRDRTGLWRTFEPKTPGLPVTIR